MTWSELLERGAVRRHETSLSELNDLRGVIERDLLDAAVKEVSNDRRFATAYSAALHSAKLAVLCSGYDTHGAGAHWHTFAAAGIALGPDSEESLHFFEVCRRMRNKIEYDRSGAASASEVEETLSKASAFHEFVEEWIAREHPDYAREE